MKTGKKAGLIILDIFVYLLGFPALMGLSVWSSMQFFEKNLYGAMAFLPVILTGIMWLIYAIVEICLRATYKKKHAKGKTNVMKQGVGLALTAVIVLSALMLVMDIALPPLLDFAAQGTIKYEDVVEGYPLQNDKQRQLLDTFIEWNVRNGNLNEITLTDAEMDGKTALEQQDMLIEKYKAVGLKNTEVDNLRKFLFAAIDYAYKKYDALAIELALEDDKYMLYSRDGISTVGLLAISAKKPYVTAPQFVITEEQFDMLGDDVAGRLVTTRDGEALEFSILDLLGGLSLGGLSVESHNEVYGVLDYMNMAWFNSVELLGIISIFSIRVWFYIFGGIVAVTAIIRAAIRKSILEPVAVKAAATDNGDLVFTDTAASEEGEYYNAAPEEMAQAPAEELQYAPTEEQQYAPAEEQVAYEAPQEEIQYEAAPAAPEAPISYEAPQEVAYEAPAQPFDLNAEAPAQAEEPKKGKKEKAPKPEKVKKEKPVKEPKAKKGKQAEVVEEPVIDIFADDAFPKNATDYTYSDTPQNDFYDGTDNK